MMHHIKPLSAELQKIACDELGEVPSRIHEDVQLLKAWCLQQPHLKARLDDNFLLQFLRGSKHSLTKAKEKIDCFHTVKMKHPELCHVTDIDTTEFRRFHNIGQMAALPTPLNECGPRIVMIRCKVSAQEYPIEVVIHYFAAVHEVMMVNDPYVSICGLVYVVDLARVSKQHIVNLLPFLRILFAIKEKALPLRMKAICLLNVDTYLEQFSKMMMGFVPSKMQKRIFICGKDFDSLGQQLPKRYLPHEYGGENGNMDQLCADFNEVWDEFRDYFKQNVEYGTDERLRFDKSNHWTDGELDGGGSFRKLEVD